MAIRSVGVGLALVSTLACAGCRSGDDPPPLRQRCASLPRLPGAERVRLDRSFDGLAIDRAVALVQHPSDDDRFYVVVQDGIVHTLRRSAPAPDPFVDISGALAIFPESGLLGMAFDPRFADNRRVYLSFDVPGGAAMTTRISRFTSDDDGLTLDPASEQVLLEVEQPYSNHNGGHIEFGPDGMLYLGLGDGGSAGDPQGNGQNPEVLLGKLLRLDVSGDGAYAIPPDNPFAQGGGRPEIWALGLRNPWRWSFDRETGELWLGDVGQNRFEEVDLIVRGGNYGWGMKEGFACIGVDDCGDPSFVDPVAVYRNNGAATVVGGQVLRGSWPGGLEGTFVYSDFYDGSIFGVTAAGGAERIGDGARGISHWLLARDGALLGLAYYGGISQLVAGTPASPAEAAAFPRRLSQTGCIDLEDPSTPPEGVVAYAINLPFWSDGADKQRAVAVPEGARARVQQDGALDWPVGTTFVKSFAKAGVPIETRLLARHDDGWVGYGYAWLADGSDAVLVEDERVDDTWIHPGLRGCPACHTEAAGGLLGGTADQLDRQQDGVDQLDRLVELGILDRRPAADPLPALDDEAVPVEARVRAYLAVNCAQCHREDGTGGRAQLDLRREVALADTGLCEDPRAGELELETPRIVAPGEPSRSVLSARLHAPGDARMPPLATAVVDDDAAALVDRWIEGLVVCP